MNPKALIGHDLAGKYHLEALLGVGGFGAVYRARQAPIDRLVAVKINLHSHRSDLQARFVREARLQAELRHPGCVMLLDCGETDGLFYLVQEFIDGQSLKQALASGPLSPTRAIDLVGQVLEALGEAHRHHIVHRDIKPANIMLTRRTDGREEVRVLDFGIAKLLVDDEDDTEILTGTGMSLGTPAYMAPEQIRPQPIGPPTDLYAVGAMLYRALIGRPVFSGATIDVLTQQLNDPPPPLPSGLVAFEGIIRKAMAKAPGDRYQSAAEMRAALRGLDVTGAAALVGVSSTDSGPTLLTPTTGGATLLTPATDPGDALATAAMAASAPVHAPPGAASEAPLGERGRSIAAALILLMAGAGIAAWRLMADDAGMVVDATLERPVIDATRPSPDAASDASALGADAAPSDAMRLEAVRPDAAPVPKPPRRTSRVRRPPQPVKPAAAKPASFEPRFMAHLAACRCPEARSTLRQIERAGDDRLETLTQRYLAACELLLPDNCTAR